MRGGGGGDDVDDGCGGGGGGGVLHVRWRVCVGLGGGGPFGAGFGVVLYGCR